MRKEQLRNCLIIALFMYAIGPDAFAGNPAKADKGLQQRYSVAHATCETDRVIKPMQPPMAGDDVAELQLRLVELGMYKGTITGIYDKPTQNSVRILQEKNGYSPDGIVNRETWGILTDDISVRTTALPPPKAPISIVIDLDATRLTVFSGNKPYHTFPIAIGKNETPSPIGEFKVVSKNLNWGGGFGTRWMGLNVPWGIYGIHGTNKPWSIGRSASHGCFRMYNQNVEILYKWIPLGTPVLVKTRYPRVTPSRVMRPGTIGQDVVYLQMALQKTLFNPGIADGRFGKMGSDAVVRLHNCYGLPSNGYVTKDTYYLLGLAKPATGK